MWTEISSILKNLALFNPLALEAMILDFGVQFQTRCGDWYSSKLSIDIFSWGSGAPTIWISKGPKQNLKGPSIEIHYQFSNLGGPLGPQAKFHSGAPLVQGPHLDFLPRAPESPVLLFSIKLCSGECHRTSLMISQHWALSAWLRICLALTGNKPLPELMLTKFNDDMS